MLFAAAAFSVLIFAAFAWAIKEHFVAERLNSVMRWLGGIGLLNYSIYLARLMFAPQATLSVLAGGLLHLASASLFISAVLATRVQRLSIAFAKSPNNFVLTTGPYAYIRHPFYVSYTLFWIGCTIETVYIPCALLTIVLVGFYIRAAHQEEVSFRSSTAADVYQKYRSRVGMFWPRKYKKESM